MISLAALLKFVRRSACRKARLKIVEDRYRGDLIDVADGLRSSLDVRTHQRAEWHETTLLVPHPKQVQVVQSCALAIEKFEDDPIDIEGSLNLAGHALREGHGQGVLDILDVHAVAVCLVAQNL